MNLVCVAQSELMIIRELTPLTAKSPRICTYRKTGRGTHAPSKVKTAPYR